jgi:hypothetical protein
MSIMGVTLMSEETPPPPPALIPIAESPSLPRLGGES